MLIFVSLNKFITINNKNIIIIYHLKAFYIITNQLYMKLFNKKIKTVSHNIINKNKFKT